jgi:catechol 2,3-dioxygenase-like lactoylglutathione lyase family enzyme
MAIHHLAFATKDLQATHAFYTGVMGFAVVKVVVAPTPTGGWAKHVFYRTDFEGDPGAAGMIAFWDLHDDSIEDSWRPDISTGMGLPIWVNHVAFDAPSLETLAACRQRWLDDGLTVSEVDHGFCTSIYTVDPNGIMVEFCCTTRPFSHREVDEAERLVHEFAPHPEPAPAVKVHRPLVVSGA